MAERCEKCHRQLADKTMRWCPKHGAELLRKLEASGYLEPLVHQTQDGEVRLSSQRFLTSMGVFDALASES